MKMKKILLTVLVTGILVCFAGYLFLAFYYGRVFGPNTWINGVYCTGKTIAEVNEELLANIVIPDITVTDTQGNTYSILLSDAGYRKDFRTGLEQYKKEHTSLLWFQHMLAGTEYQLEPSVSYDEEKLKETFYALPPIAGELSREKSYYIFKDEEKGYQLYDGLSGRIDTDKLFSLFLQAVETGNTSFDLNRAECIYHIPMTQDEQEIQKLWDKLSVFLHCNIIYDMGDSQIALSPKIMADFLKQKNDIPITDEQGELVLDESAVEEFVNGLAEQYDTYGKKRQFTATNGETVTIEKGTYGTELDREEEVKYLLEQLPLKEAHTQQLQKHIPAYTREGFVRGKDDLGDTYVEISITEQKMYYYEAGKLLLETDVVTGNSKRRMDTPKGIYYVYAKQKNRILRGADYASFVKYWMPVNGNIGIHDAGWRSKFGGEIYMDGGSHGCINTPSDVMGEFFDLVELGTPVVII